MSEINEISANEAEKAGYGAVWENVHNNDRFQCCVDA